MLRGRGSLGAGLWCLRRGPGVLGLSIEDRLRVCALESPVAVPDLGLKLTRCPAGVADEEDRKSTRLNSSHRCISYAVFCLKKKIRAKYEAFVDSKQSAALQPYRPSVSADGTA